MVSHDDLTLLLGKRPIISFSKAKVCNVAKASPVPEMIKQIIAELVK